MPHYSIEKMVSKKRCGAPFYRGCLQGWSEKNEFKGQDDMKKSSFFGSQCHRSVEELVELPVSSASVEVVEAASHQAVKGWKLKIVLVKELSVIVP